MSTTENADLQIDAPRKAGCERIYTDHASGAKAHRPQLDRMIESLRESDTVVVWKLDRPGHAASSTSWPCWIASAPPNGF
ncbi:DNA invertase Pin-like site-specific DNA recombinase [Bifidobacterium commune]|uniref:recombinase family protein n=1 Tax=Bifidobacterium commune TaxID=1505727 RepID=UPI00184C593B|nr:recombinase family protein [Bifidobacterium commune]MBB2955791.1 DNA invertase Pin-like site-specific DNA recombinase [Bifidobacterium commune]